VTTAPESVSRRQGQAADLDVVRLWLAFALVVIGIIAVLIAFVVGVTSLDDTNQKTVVALVSAVATAVGTLVGFVAGHKLGSAGKEKAEQRADDVQQRLDAVIHTHGDVLQAAAKTHPDLFPHLRQTP
jgi:membrane protein DedA with SNARE-associated domain